ncbi:UDP-N-acetylmuramoyl-L-alanyl-D-glutamate--2,6-diaminopimelate ligase [Spiribacter salinus]|uniref:UDP-N-acetylmuramoyl-L-alanyl-D-glutamate--2, 6-diaminopimelate ligase n=1 Tax=Spiribacter salinus TaxID=1335746 RepID=UPI001C9617F2|nr:UDP-N-acetylmuramoyl-L-alanyl-D-glutamate--2,6-diaminopimelate ligase [Spiribacter salinus]MBY5269055.1 UDP-N-acetylmuramoyl-L-alanyl-D-glutamate--2,6-diaminopimelate ligase [Spiribacter salinus]
MSAARSAKALLAPWVDSAGLDETALAGLTMTSGEVVNGGLFMAVAGSVGHGLDYVDEAIAKGAALIAWEPTDDLETTQAIRQCEAAGVPMVAVPELARHAGAIAARYYDEPAASLRIIGVTGTDGKTSVAHGIATVLETLGVPAALMGTLGWGRVGQLTTDSLTTADAVTLQRRFAMLREAGVRAVAMEVSSHALAQHRVDAVPFDTAVLTHVGRDHLDYHGSVAAYRAAKRRLFTRPGLRRQILNIDDDLGAELATAADAPGDRLTYGRTEAADLQLLSAEPRPSGLVLTLRIHGLRRTSELGLIGPFNAMNALATLGAVLDGQPAETALEALARLQPVPGRMERFIAPGRPLVVVDYAHTPGALEAALQGVRPHTRGRLICVFGCGGDRDRGKRALMGDIASRLADEVRLTNDNPRGESPDAIIAEIQAGCRSGTPCQVEKDRHTAIQQAIEAAKPGDTVLVAGKGHEETQVIGQRVSRFSDRESVGALLTGEAG